MTALRACVLALLLGLPACTVSAQPGPPDYPSADTADYPSPDDDAPDPQDYEQSLSPYGRWRDAPTYGRVWVPAVSVGWQPYVQGYWAWSPYGWTWVSYEPWGWTFHYGRWAYLPTGWVWVPGHVWGPAWVDWYSGDGYVGWAPLAPFGHHVTVINHFVFVNDRDFCSRRVNHYVRDWRRVPRGVARGWGRRDFRPPPRDRITRIAREPVHRFNGRPPGTIGPPALDRRPGNRGPRLGEPGHRRANAPGRSDLDAPRRARPEAETPRQDRRDDDRNPWRRRADANPRRFDDDQPGRRQGRGDDEAADPQPRVEQPRRFGSAPAPGWQRGGRAVREPGGFVTPQVPRAARQPVAPDAPRAYGAPRKVGSVPVGGAAPTMVAPRMGGPGASARMNGRPDGGDGGGSGSRSGGGDQGTRGDAGGGHGRAGGRGVTGNTGMAFGR